MEDKNIQPINNPVQSGSTVKPAAQSEKPAEPTVKTVDTAEKSTDTTLQAKPTGGTLMKTKDLKKSFYIGLPNEAEILKGINIEIEKGDFVIIFGPSGCGKSTLLHTLLGLEPPTSGNIMLEDQDFYSLSDDKRAEYRRHKVGIIYQQPLWISSLNVGQNITFTLKLLNLEESKSDGRVVEVLSLVGMQDWKDYHPKELSSGQQQKVSLARALAVDPVLIVADEPTGNLDTISGKQLIDHFNQFNKKGITIIMVTHDLEYLKFANRVIHMIDGVVVEQYVGKPGESFNREAQGKRGETPENENAGINVRDPKFLTNLKGDHSGKIEQLVDKVDEPKEEPSIPQDKIGVNPKKPIPVNQGDYVEGINHENKKLKMESKNLQ